LNALKFAKAGQEKEANEWKSSVPELTDRGLLTLKIELYEHAFLNCLFAEQIRKVMIRFFHYLLIIVFFLLLSKMI
jgi:hypothetical protein